MFSGTAGAAGVHNIVPYSFTSLWCCILTTVMCKDYLKGDQTKCLMQCYSKLQLSHQLIIPQYEVQQAFGALKQLHARAVYKKQKQNRSTLLANYV